MKEGFFRVPYCPQLFRPLEGINMGVLGIEAEVSIFVTLPFSVKVIVAVQMAVILSTPFTVVHSTGEES